MKLQDLCGLRSCQQTVSSTTLIAHLEVLQAWLASTSMVEAQQGVLLRYPPQICLLVKVDADAKSAADFIQLRCFARFATSRGDKCCIRIRFASFIFSPAALGVSLGVCKHSFLNRSPKGGTGQTLAADVAA